MAGINDRLLPSLIDWPRFWRRESGADEEWLLEPLIARNRGHSLVAKGGEGKSLLIQECAFALASGRPILYRKDPEPVPVLYVDLEMTESDVFDRACDYGYTDTDDLSNLYYLLLPDLDPLDTKRGGDQLVEAACDLKVQLVIVDTLARAISGKENDSDTLIAFYRWTGQRLKKSNITWWRADHVGKDGSKGGRGTSAKNDDVDVVWQMSTKDTSVILDCTKRRMNWVPPTVQLERKTIPHLHHFLADAVVDPKLLDTLAKLKELNVPHGTGREVARRVLRESGFSVGNDVLARAIRMWHS